MGIQFRTEANIYRKIMQNIKNARKQLKTPASHRLCVDKLQIIFVKIRMKNFNENNANMVTLIEVLEITNYMEKMQFT